MVMIADTKTLMDMERNIHFRNLLGPASLSIRNATEILPTAMLKMHSEREMVFSSRASDNCEGLKYSICLA